MKKISLLFLLLLSMAATAVAQTSIPRPLNPTVDDWIDQGPVIFTDTVTGEPVEYRTSCQMMFAIGMDLMQRPVADDYLGFESDELITGELTYTLLDPEKVSYTVFTDFDEEFVFTPEVYPGLSEPTTRIPFGFEENNIEFWFVHFPGKTNDVEPLREAGFDVEPFFQWRIGIRTNYIDGDQESYSDIVYWEICDKPVSLLGDVDDNGKVDISDVATLIDYILSPNLVQINKFNADVAENEKINIDDLTALIDKILS